MNKIKVLFLVFISLSYPLFAKGIKSDVFFNEFNKPALWKTAFNDSGTIDWTTHWFVDGEQATISNTAAGMIFTTGDKEMDPAHHSVLWTKQSFSGDIKIEYDYTRLDSEHKWATMLYIQATGTGEAPYDEDIRQWSALRDIPAMKTYFNNMNLLHISYAAFGKEDKGYQADYVRARRYPVTKGRRFSTDTVITGDSFETALFNTGEQYHVTVIKKGHQLFMEFKNSQRRRLFYWDSSNFPKVTHGRIGLRQMWRKSAIYKNFTISIVK